MSKEFSMQSITFSFYPSGRSPQDLGSFSAAPFSSSPGDFRYASLIRPQPINRLPVFFGNRFLADIPVTFAYSHPPFGKSKAVLSVSGGLLKEESLKSMRARMMSKIKAGVFTS